MGSVSTSGRLAEPLLSKDNMAHFAHITNGIVDNVIVIDQETLNSGNWGDPAEWIQTSYNANIRMNFAGVGFTYDSVRDAFYAPQPYPSWILNEANCQWAAPIPMPVDGKRYAWDEATLSWVFVKEPLPAVSARQIRQALTLANLRDQVEAAVATGDQDLKDWWGYSNDFERLNPQVTAMGTALAQTDKQLDDLWILGATL